MQLLPLAVCLDNYPHKYRGRVTGVINISRALGVTMMMAIYTAFFREEPLGNYFLTLGVAAAVVCIAAIVFLQSVPPERTEDEEVTHLIPKRGLFLPEAEVYETLWDHIGFNHFRVAEFQLLLWGILFSGSLKLMYMTNVTTFAHGYEIRDLGQLMTIIGPVCGMVSTIAVAIISDRTRRIMPRVAYLVVGASFQTIMFFISIFVGDNALVYLITTIVVYADMGILTLTGITLTSEYFGMSHFARNWGLIAMLKAILNVGYCRLFGAFYERAISEEGGQECFGLSCFRNTYVFNCLSSFLSVMLLSVLWSSDARKRCFNSPIYKGCNERLIVSADRQDAAKYGI